MQNLQYEYLDNRYQNLTILGSEGKKSTYLAKDTVSGKIVVKKYIQSESVAVYAQMCMLQSPHLLKIYHVAQKEDGALVIMEYVSGSTIEECQKERTVFSEAETIDCIEQLLDGLLSIHKYDIVHRDINPKNILLSTDGVIKILDFDIGRQYKESKNSDTTILGTVGFAAPEQFGFTQSDKRTDIYAVGVLMNVMLTGQLPKMHLYAKGKIGDIIRTCIQIDPQNRYQNIGEIKQEISLLKSENEENKEKSTEKPIEENGQYKSIWPGFRTGKTWKKIVAMIYYCFWGFYSVANIVKCAITPLGFILECIAVFTYLWLAMLLPMNFLHWMDKMPGVRKLTRIGRIGLGIFLWLVLFYFGVLLDNYVHYDLLHLAVRPVE